MPSNSCASPKGAMLRSNSTYSNQNLAPMFALYISPMLILVAAGGIALRWRRSVLLLFGTLALAAAVFFRIALYGLS